MSEPDKSKAVVGGLKPPRFSRKTKIRAAALLFVVLVVGGALLFLQIKNSRGKTVTIDGKTYIVRDYTTASSNKSNNKTTTSPTDADSQIKTLESKIAKQPTYENYLALAQLYLTKGDKQKALSFYTKARDALRPNAKYYKETVESLNATIKYIKDNS